MSRSWIYEAIRRREFPAQFAIGARAVAWDSAAVARWQEHRIEQSLKATFKQGQRWIPKKKPLAVDHSCLG
jgi:hypothetical protein